MLIGKGVTFDTGGISIKPAQNMEDMKYDMSGAAAVLGTFEMLGRLKPKVHVVGLIPSTENMPSGTAVKPGDVVTSHSGKTIEIINTDAEGRLILCDALSYARRYQPGGRARHRHAHRRHRGGAGPHRHRRDGHRRPAGRRGPRGRRAGGRAGLAAAALGRVPRADEVGHRRREERGGRPAGSISAGWFLREFVDGFPWAHLDIAGTAYTDREEPARVKGPTGMGVRLFSEFVLGRSSVSGERDVTGGPTRPARSSLRRFLSCSLLLVARPGPGPDERFGYADSARRRTRSIRPRASSRRSSNRASPVMPVLAARGAPTRAHPHRLYPGLDRVGPRRDGGRSARPRSRASTSGAAGYIGRPEPVNFQARGASSAEYYLDGMPYVAAGVDSVAVDPALFLSSSSIGSKSSAGPGCSGSISSPAATTICAPRRASP